MFESRTLELINSRLKKMETDKEVRSTSTPSKSREIPDSKSEVTTPQSTSKGIDEVGSISDLEKSKSTPIDREEIIDTPEDEGSEVISSEGVVDTPESDELAGELFMDTTIDSENINKDLVSEGIVDTDLPLIEDMEVAELIDSPSSESEGVNISEVSIPESINSELSDEEISTPESIDRELSLSEVSIPESINSELSDEEISTINIEDKTDLDVSEASELTQSESDGASDIELDKTPQSNNPDLNENQITTPESGTSTDSDPKDLLDTSETENRDLLTDEDLILTTPRKSDEYYMSELKIASIPTAKSLGYGDADKTFLQRAEELTYKYLDLSILVSQDLLNNSYSGIVKTLMHPKAKVLMSKISDLVRNSVPMLKYFHSLVSDIKTDYGARLAQFILASTRGLYKGLDGFVLDPKYPIPGNVISKIPIAKLKEGGIELPNEYIGLESQYQHPDTLKPSKSQGSDGIAEVDDQDLDTEEEFIHNLPGTEEGSDIDSDKDEGKKFIHNLPGGSDGIASIMHSYDMNKSLSILSEFNTLEFATFNQWKVTTYDISGKMLHPGHFFKSGGDIGKTLYNNIKKLGFRVIDIDYNVSQYSTYQLTLHRTGFTFPTGSDLETSMTVTFLDDRDMTVYNTFKMYSKYLLANPNSKYCYDPRDIAIPFQFVVYGTMAMNLIKNCSSESDLDRLMRKEAYLDCSFYVVPHELHDSLNISNEATAKDYDITFSIIGMETFKLYTGSGKTKLDIL